MRRHFLPRRTGLTHSRPAIVRDPGHSVSPMRRRDFIILAGGAVALPLAAGAQQQPAMPLVGVMTSSAASARSTAAFREGLKQAGFVEGNNVVLDYRSAEGQVDRVPAIISDLV